MRQGIRYESNERLVASERGMGVGGTWNAISRVLGAFPLTFVVLGPVVVCILCSVDYYITGWNLFN